MTDGDSGGSWRDFALFGGHWFDDLCAVQRWLCLGSLQVKSLPCENQWKKVLFVSSFPFSTAFALIPALISFYLFVSETILYCTQKDSLHLIFFPAPLGRVREESYPRLK